MAEDPELVQIAEATLAAQVEQADITPSQKEKLLALLHSYVDIFVFGDQPVGVTGTYLHHINLKPGAQPVRCPPYRTNPKQRELLKEHIDRLKAQGIIQDSISQWSSPILLVPKKGNKTRLVVDYRQVNKMIAIDHFPLPRIQDSLQSLSDPQIFSSLDLADGYYQMPLHPASRPITAFCTDSQLLEFTRSPQGLACSPGNFSRMISQVFKDEHHKFLILYLDDLLLWSSNFDQHLQHLSQVFDKLRAANLRVKPSKCEFARQQVSYLGHLLTPEGIRPDPDKVRAIVEATPPHNLKKLRSWLGLASYYRSFIKGFSKIAQPLTALLKHDAPYDWTEDCQMAFNALKRAMTTAPVLVYPRYDRAFLIQCDASSKGLGVILAQEGDDGKVHPCAFAARSLTPGEKNYSAYRLELTALLFAVKKFSPYLRFHKFVVETDCLALRHLMTMPNVPPQIARSLEILAGYDFEIRYRPGRINQPADHLSRYPPDSDCSEKPPDSTHTDSAGTLMPSATAVLSAPEPDTAHPQSWISNTACVSHDQADSVLTSTVHMRSEWVTASESLQPQ